MKTIIAGLGKIGWAVAEQLLAENHDLTIIDIDEERIESASNSLDVITIEGNASNCEILEAADIANTDMMIATTDSDAMNLVCCMVGKRMGAKHTIARVRDTAYLRQADFLRESFGLSMLVNPELEVANEIARILRFPTATRVESFSRGRLRLAEYPLEKNSALVGVPLSKLEMVSRAGILICAVERDDHVVIPKGDFVLEPGDSLTLAAEPKDLRSFFKKLGVYRRAAKSVLILGGGRIAVYLARALDVYGIETRIVERNLDRCRELSELLPHTEIIHGDGSRRELLLEQRIANTDGFVALTGSDEENLILSMYAHSCGVRSVIAKVNEEHLSAMLEDTGLNCFVNSKQVVVQQIMQYVRALQNSMGSSVETLYRIVDGRVEALEFIVSSSAHCINTPLKNLPLRSDVLVVGITRNNEMLVPSGDSVILPGDRIIVVTTQSGLQDLDDILTEKRK